MKLHRAFWLAFAIAIAGTSYIAWAELGKDNHAAMNQAPMVHDTMTMDAMAGMEMPAVTLLLAQLDGEQTVPPSGSKATATGAFQLDPVARTIEYRLTYQGLESGQAQSIALYNFGRGKTGAVVYLLCSAGRQPCPDGASATITGRIERNGAPLTGVGEFEGPPLDNTLISEMASERVYVEIVGEDGKAEIRGQLGPNDAQSMVESFVANLAPTDSGSKATGTAVVSKIHLPGGKVIVSYNATVAGTSDVPQSAAVGSKRALRNKISLRVPKVKVSRNKQGGSVMGSYKVDMAASDAVPSLGTVISGQDQPGFIIPTSKFPDGEVFGVLQPVK
jgi:hypothetical protein